MLFFLSSLITFGLLVRQCLAENVTAVNQLIFALNGNNISHAYDNVFGSVIAADKNAITVHLDCRPTPTSTSNPTTCSDQDATITAGPSTLVYTSSLGSLYAYRACSKTMDGGEFVCTFHNHVHESQSIDKIVSFQGHGGYAPMQITAGIDKLTNAPDVQVTASGTAKVFGGGRRTTWTMLWSSLGITFLIITVLG
ncbi:hypothetical protein FKW77_003795 [Venturia effusa]|uniref:Autophagy-related protein 27 n=1 Tax=Venturia effusa TaxID=50376 RepID=A0A517LML0_9PEZI|nr:hypothetical protein FKW77_003795 [Venturia effusa]